MTSATPADPLAELPALPRRCASCAHAEHRQACRGKAPSGCQPLTASDGGPAVGFICYRGRRPPCACPARVCKCGARVVTATLVDEHDRIVPPPAEYGDGSVDVPVVLGSAGDPAGQLEVWRCDTDGSLLCRELGDGEIITRPARWRGTEHTGPCQQF